MDEHLTSAIVVGMSTIRWNRVCQLLNHTVGHQQ